MDIDAVAKETVKEIYKKGEELKAQNEMPSPPCFLLMSSDMRDDLIKIFKAAKYDTIVDELNDLPELDDYWLKE